MPHVQITLLEGRSPEQKRKVVERVTQTLVEELGTNKEAVVITFLEVSSADYASAGSLALDKQKK